MRGQPTTSRPWRTVTIVLATLSFAGLAAALGAIAVVYSGIYNVGATKQHQQWMYTLLEDAMRQSVRLRARRIDAPPDLATNEQRLVQGAACFRDKCVQCHGAPGVAQGDIGKSMQPLPGPLADANQRWNARELYWVTRHGIKMSGMPAWEFRLSDEELWNVTAFLQRLPQLTPQQYAAITAAPVVQVTPGAPAPSSCGLRHEAAASGAPGDVRRGERALYQYACNACHTIPGITGSFPNVGPPLDGIARRTLIAGKLDNTPDNMVRWLLHTKEVAPQSAMPQMGVSERDARDIAAYLGTLR